VRRGRWECGTSTRRDGTIDEVSPGSRPPAYFVDTRSYFVRAASVLLPPPTDDVFHPILQLQLALFQGDFFDLFGFREVMFCVEFVQATFEFVMLGGELMKLLVRLQQQFLEVLRLLIHAPPPCAWVLNEWWECCAACETCCTAERNITGADDSRTSGFLRKALPPEHERVFDRMSVIAVPHAGFGEAESFIQPARRVVRPADLERRARGAELSAFLQHAREQSRGDPRAPKCRRDGEVIDVYFVEDTPERTEADHAALGIFRAV